MSTTTSCRFFAQAVAISLLVGAPAAASVRPQSQVAPVPPLPPEQSQPVPQLPPEQPKPVTAAPQSPMAKPADATAQPRRNDPVGEPLPIAQRWSKSIPASTTLPPVMHGRQVFAFVPPGAVASFGLDDGAELWRVDLQPDHPFAVYDGKLFVAAGEAFHALDARTGQVAWRQPTGTLTAPPLVHGGWVIVASGNEVVASRAADGAVVWRRPHGAPRHAPTIEGDQLFLPLADARVLAVTLTTGEVQWERKLGDQPSEIAALGDRIYVGSADKYFYCLDAEDGDREWRHRIGAVVIGRPAIDARRVYVATTDNLLRAFDRVDGALKWQAPLPFRPYSGPVLLGTVVLAPGYVAELQTLDAATGKPGAGLALGAPLAGPLAVQASDRGPLAAAITGGVAGDWRLSIWEPATSIPTAPLTVLPGTPVPLPAAPSAAAAVR